MSGTMKLIITILLGGMLACALVGAGAYLFLQTGGRTLAQVIRNNPADKVAAAIAAYEVPAGFDDGTAMDVAGLAFVSYTGDDNHSHIMFFQLPAGVRLDRDKIESQLNQTAGRENAREHQARVVDQFDTAICGQQTVMVISEGLNSDGQKFRQATATFEGRGGQALVMYEAPISAWDQATVDAFFASIH